MSEDIVERPIPIERTMLGETVYGIPVVAWYWEEPSVFGPIPRIAYHWSTPATQYPITRLVDAGEIAKLNVERDALRAKLDTAVKALEDIAGYDHAPFSVTVHARTALSSIKEGQ